MYTLPVILTKILRSMRKLYRIKVAFKRGEEMKNNVFILITGATDGIGLRSSIEFARKGKNLIIHGKNEIKLKETAERLKKLNSKIDVKTVCANFENLRETKDVFEQIKNESINCLINNAGCFTHELKLTIDGFEKTYQVNHLAHFLITHILLDSLIKNAPSKIIVVASMAHANSVDFETIEKGIFPKAYEAYSISKLCNILFAFKMARELKNKNVSVNALHPGVINTKLLIEGWGACGSSPENSHKIIDFAYDLDNSTTGQYLKDLKIQKATKFAYSKENQDKCYEVSKKQLSKIKFI